VLPDTVIVEKLCERFRLAADACTKTKREFAERVGLSSSQFSNLGNNRNPPPHTAIYKAWVEFGIPADYFYHGVKAGIRDPAIAKRLSALESQAELTA
jgi:transcriptional regulator with XRE-family HTH domain